MSKLIIVSKPLDDMSELQILLDNDDIVLFTQDGCYSLMHLNINTNNVFALKNDIQARKLSCPKSVVQIDYSRFVELVTDTHHSITL